MYITFNDISWNEYLFWQKNDKHKINLFADVITLLIELFHQVITSL